jgi:hypothetical protein
MQKRLLLAALIAFVSTCSGHAQAPRAPIRLGQIELSSAGNIVWILDRGLSRLYACQADTSNPLVTPGCTKFFQLPSMSGNQKQRFNISGTSFGFVFAVSDLGEVYTCRRDPPTNTVGCSPKMGLP